MNKDSMCNKGIICNKKLLVNNIIYCDSILRKASGLMFRSRKSVEDTAWWFRFKNPRRVTITMFMVFFPIDVIFLDDKNMIVELKENLKSFSNYRSKKKIFTFLELKSGIIRKNSLKTGMFIKLK
jgi:uncharacterized protein